MLPFGLLIAALLVFLLSTRQFALWLRAVIWVIGASAVAAAAVLLWAGSGSQWISLVADRRIPLALIWNALVLNQDVVVDFLAPLVVGLFLVVAFIAMATLIAFTPGERIERVVRWCIVALFGSLFGGVLALAIVAVGFGGHRKRHVLIDFVSADDVIDGDGFRMGDFALRLAGIDAPEEFQECIESRRRVPCGEQAAIELRRIVGGAVVVCRRPSWLTRNQDRPPRETFGRPMVQCEAHRNGRASDVAEQMALAGFAVEYKGVAGHYREQVRQAGAVPRGLWRMCTLRPDVWRRRTERRAFQERGVMPDAPDDRIGCQAEPAP